MTGQLFTVPPNLTERQAYVLRRIELYGPSRAEIIGHALHIEIKGCGECRRGFPCEYAATAGREVLEALRRKGLLKRDRHHIYRRADSEAGLYDPATAEWPEGF